MTNAEKEAEEWAKKELGTIRIPLEYKKNLPIFERLEREDKKLKASCKAAFLAGRASAPKIEDQRAKLLEQIKAYSFDKDTRGIHGYMVDEDIVRMEDVNKILGKSTASLPEPPEDK